MSQFKFWDLYHKIQGIYVFGSQIGMSLPRTSKDLNFLSSCITPKSWQKHQFLVNFYWVIPQKKSFQKKSSKKIFPKKSSTKKSSQKFLPKKILKINSFNKILLKIPKNFQKIFQRISQKISKILKVSNFLHRTWKPKTLSGLFTTSMYTSENLANFWPLP